jgi:hypothetical protein
MAETEFLTSTTLRGRPGSCQCENLYAIAPRHTFKLLATEQAFVCCRGDGAHKLCRCVPFQLFRDERRALRSVGK